MLDGPGCNPNQCSILDGPGCLAQPQRGVGENLQLTLGTRAAGDAKKPDGELNTIRDLFAALRSCWAPPAVGERLSRHADVDALFAQSRGQADRRTARHLCDACEVSQKTRDVYRDAIPQSLRELHAAADHKGLCGAIAGRPIVVRVIDNRDDVAQDEAAGAEPVLADI